MKHLNWICGVLLLILFFLSLKTLTTFPDLFDDEGLYAAFAQALGETGKTHYLGYAVEAPYTQGNALVTHFHTGLYACIAKLFGYTFTSARAVSFSLFLISVLLWGFISRRIGFPVFIGTFLFASTERLFHASHVFRPEISLIFINCLYLFLFTNRPDAPLKPTTSFARGLFNSLFVIAHGNGIASVAINCYDMATRSFFTLKKHFLANGIYYCGSIIAVGLFYFFQVSSIGWSDFVLQLKAQPVQHKTFLELIQTDIVLRWGRELVVVGGSLVAKFMRAYFYIVIFFTAAYSVAKLTTQARQAGTMVFICVLAYVFLIRDKVDIHIAEMMPFFLFSFMLYFVTLQKQKRSLLPGVLLVSLLLVNSFLTFHHVFKYAEKSIPEARVDILVNFLDQETIRPASEYKIFVGKLTYWFQLHDRMQMIHQRFLEQHLPFKGGVIATDDVLELPFLIKNCKIDYTDPSGIFRAFYCP
ncbi:MAG: hypothetical protein SGI74_09300 [Oligoflexia bacterium]|nr:hypothetical protein [Oligoflexia bacterium]